MRVFLTGFIFSLPFLFATPFNSASADQRGECQISGESETLEQVARDTGAMICELYSDSLDDKVSTYIEMMRFNADEIARCLGGVNGG